MYLLRDEGYSSGTNNNYSATIDYIETLNWGNQRLCNNTYSSVINYIESRDYYACTELVLANPITWDLWAENWELIDTNWNNEII